MSRVREVKGFGDCKSLSEIEIPASVESIGGFNGSSLSQLVLARRTMIKEIKVQTIWEEKRCSPRVFVVYDEGDLKKNRSRLNMK